MSHFSRGSKRRQSSASPVLLVGRAQRSVSETRLRVCISRNVRKGASANRRGIDGVGNSVGHRAKAYQAGRKYCCITGECGADDPVAAAVADVVIVGRKVALVA
jgi:hypothetical protein